MRRLPPTVLLLCAMACGSDEDEGTSNGSATTKLPTAASAQALTDYVQVVNLNYAEVLAGARALQTAIDAFVAAPSEATHKAAKDAWIAARTPYGPSEAFRFYEGPIDNEQDGPEGLINAWPLDENYIDYTREQPTAGNINDHSKPLDPASIEAANENGGAEGGEKAISTGYHAIEFLLWGQDDATPGLGSGKRPFTDYVSGPTGTAANQARRGTYLKTIAQLLVGHLESVADQWKPGQANYAADFVKDPQTSLGDILSALGSMAKAELSGERMTVAYRNRSEEDEHSCFSDNTAADLLGNGLGLQNVWLGRYGSFQGTGIEKVVNAVDPALAAATTTDINTSVAKLQALVDLQNAGKPIDVVIQAADGSPERLAMLEAIQSLKKVASDVERVATALGLSVQFEEPSETL